MASEATQRVPLPPQVAVLGSSGDIATDGELALAAAVGRELALRKIVCVTGGDDGVMGEAARAAKAQGGTTVAIVARDKTIANGSTFDACVNTGLAWVQFSDSILRSCVGAVVLGGGAGTLGELAVFYLAERPVAFCGAGQLATMFADRPLDQRELVVFPAFDDPVAAVDHVMGAIAGSGASATSIAAGAELHFNSYPFGSAALYREAAAHFREAVALAGRDGQASARASASLEDALADVEYYIRQDFFGAASHYSRALRHAKAADDAAFSAYLVAIMLESIATALHEHGLDRTGAAVALESAHHYEAAMAVTPADEHKYLRHSADGLRGDAALFEAHDHFDAGRLDAAHQALESARAAYAAALVHHPPYGENVSSSNYNRVLQQVDELEAKLRAFPDDDREMEQFS